MIHVLPLLGAGWKYLAKGLVAVYGYFSPSSSPQPVAPLTVTLPCPISEFREHLDIGFRILHRKLDVLWTWLFWVKVVLILNTISLGFVVYKVNQTIELRIILEKQDHNIIDKSIPEDSET